MLYYKFILTPKILLPGSQLFKEKIKFGRETSYARVNRKFCHEKGVYRERGNIK